MTSHLGPCFSQLLNEVSTCRSELKKLTKILVGSDSDLFPSPENDKQCFQSKATPEIRVIAARSAKRPTLSHPLYDPDHVQTSVASRLINFSFLNAVTVSFKSSSTITHDLTTLQGDLLAHPILEKLCQSFYEEEKWQRSLMLQLNGDSEWMSSVTVVMVAFAAMAVSTPTWVGDLARSKLTRSITMPLKSGGLVTLFRSHSKWKGSWECMLTSILTLQIALAMIPRLSRWLIISGPGQRRGTLFLPSL